MNILAFDCSTADIYLYLKWGDKSKVVVHKNCLATEFLVEKIDLLLKDAGISIKDINVVGVGVGPGSFTGSRVAVVTAKAFASVFDIKLIVFNSFELLSYNETKEKVVRVVEGFSDFVYAEGDELESVCIKKDELLAALGRNTVIVSRCGGFEGYNNIVMDYNLEKVVLDKFSKKDFVDILALEPVYLRASQAEIQLEQKRAKNENKKND